MFAHAIAPGLFTHAINKSRPAQLNLLDHFLLACACILIYSLTYDGLEYCLRYCPVESLRKLGEIHVAEVRSGRPVHVQQRQGRRQHVAVALQQEYQVTTPDL